MYAGRDVHEVADLCVVIDRARRIENDAPPDPARATDDGTRANHRPVAHRGAAAHDGRRVTRDRKPSRQISEAIVQMGTAHVVAHGHDDGVVLDSRDCCNRTEHTDPQTLLPMQRGIVVHVPDDFDGVARGALREQDVGDHLAVSSSADNQDPHWLSMPLNSCAVA